MSTSMIRRLGLLLSLVLFLGTADAALHGRDAEARGRGGRKAQIQKQRMRTRQKAIERRARRKAKARARSRARAEGFLPRSQAELSRATRDESSQNTLARTQVSRTDPLRESVRAAEPRVAAEVRPELLAPEISTRAPEIAATPGATRTRRTRSRSRSRIARQARRTVEIPASEPMLASPEPIASAALAAAPRSLTSPERRTRTGSATRDARETKALKAISSRLSRRGGVRWEVSTPVLQYVGDKSNPVTGSGPIEVIARQKQQPTSLLGRLARAFRPSTERRFMVVVDPHGRTQVLAEQANSWPYRLARNLNEKLGLTELVNDTIRSQGVRNGLGLSAGGVALAATGTPLSWAAAGGLIVSGLRMAAQGVDRRQVARKSAMERTVADIKADLAQKETVTLIEAYRTYTRELENTKPGTTPLSLRKFTAELSTYGL